MLLFILFIQCVTGSVPWLEQISRQEGLQSGCERFKPEKTNLLQDDLDHLLVDHEHRFLYCYVPKVACTNWKRVLMVLTGRSNATNIAAISASFAHRDGVLIRLSSLPPNEIDSILANYTLFLMVRHPFERVLSAYRNKLEDNHPSARYFHGVFGKHIIKRYRKNPTLRDIELGDNVTFREFVRFLIAEGVGSAANEHWRSVYSLCNPCRLNYTFIGKYESFVEDAEAVLNMINAPKLTFPHTRSAHTSQRLRNYYQQLNLQEIEELYRLYESDFKLFGYSLDNLLGYDIG